jgi:hypothetical protein
MFLLFLLSKIQILFHLRYFLSRISHLTVDCCTNYELQYSKVSRPAAVLLVETRNECLYCSTYRTEWVTQYRRREQQAAAASTHQQMFADTTVACVRAFGKVQVRLR